MRPDGAGDVSPDMRTPYSERHVKNALSAYPGSRITDPRTLEVACVWIAAGKNSRGQVSALTEEVQRRGVDDLRSFDEPEVPGVGNLQVTAVGDSVSDLAAEVCGQHHIVREADDKHRRRNTSVSGQPVAL